ncbi:protein SAMBA isoform X1 [Cynara cardunculus var. scolymus]|uniref:protein SAMBA isoform X1 n=1 Tax=Cynara cardunculus var. scolymus TaxID=59895 RepID=UPI000D627EBD|nr:protein SAMBA isoform X1 [Cynara cardunculus var. scolymus]
MSNSSLTSSPARSSISTTAIVGSNAMSSSLAVDEVHFSTDLITIQDRKDEALRALKSDLMATLNKEVRMLDEDSWMFEGPRSRIHLISRPVSGGLLNKHAETMKHKLATQKRTQNASIK